MALNKVILQGRLTGDPELKTTTAGVTVTSFSIAVERNYQANGQRESDFFNVTAWRKTAEFISRFFTKGNKILLVGELQQRSYQTQQGEKRTVVEVIANEAYFCDGKKAENEQNEIQFPTPQFAVSNDNNFEEMSTEDVLPF
jgi:single-strand DNA-binding protein